MRNYRQIDAIVSEWTRSKPAAEVADILDRIGVPAGPVRSTHDALSDPRVLARGDVVPLKHPTYGATHEVYGPGIPIKFGGRRYPEDVAMPEYGEHNNAIYRELLGYDDKRIESLIASGAI
jgi:crotonobetainyl-CoA:carnitine CoA-transferase CaiB-like acyl-CoA transferase